MSDTRWKQRFENFSRAFVLLRSALEERPLEDFSDLEREGIIQRFEYSYELARKTFKEYLEDSGVAFAPLTPRNVIKESRHSRLFPLAPSRHNPYTCAVCHQHSIAVLTE